MTKNEIATTIIESINDEFNEFDLILTDANATMRALINFMIDDEYADLDNSFDAADLDARDELISNMIINFARTIANSINARDYADLDASIALHITSLICELI